MQDHKSAFEAIYGEVISQGLCVACGACVGYCPYLEYKDGKVVIIDSCKVGTGRCEAVCPQMDILRNGPGKAALEEGGGYFLSKALPKEFTKNAQYGGVVSAMVSYLLSTGRAEKAVLTDRGGKGSPKGVLVHSPLEVISLGGSRYTASASLSALNRLLKDGQPQRVVVVGLPCQMRAVSLMEKRSEIRSEQVFKIGLFCTWAMEYREMSKLLEKEGVLETPIRFDIPPPPKNIFLVEGQRGKWEIPLDRMRVAIQKGCALCPDMTGSYADISVGAAEGIEGHNTVCVRDTRGFELLEELTQKGILKVEALPEANLSHLKTAIKNKRERATTKLKERVSHGDI